MDSGFDSVPTVNAISLSTLTAGALCSFGSYRCRAADKNISYLQSQFTF